MNTANQVRREVMEMAWGLFRAERGSVNPRTFADALAGAWRWVKGRVARMADNAAWLRRVNGGTVAFRSMLQSPIRRRVGSGWDAYKAEYVTTSVGG